MSIALIIIISYFASVLLGWIASFCFAPIIAKRQINRPAQRKFVLGNEVERWIDAKDDLTRYGWESSEEVRGGGVLNEHQFKFELNLLRWLFPIGLFRQLTQISDTMLIEKNDPKIIEAKEHQRKSEFAELKERIYLLEKQDKHYRETGELL